MVRFGRIGDGKEKSYRIEQSEKKKIKNKNNNKNIMLVSCKLITLLRSTLDTLSTLVFFIIGIIVLTSTLRRPARVFR